MTAGLAKSLRRPVRVLLATASFLLLVALWSIVRAPIELETSPLLIHDVTQLNSIGVGRVIVPTTTQEIVEAVKGFPGPISVGGARHSMGGQIATAGALHIDMRRFDQILAFAPSEKTITVQAGTRWRQVQERIDPSNLSVSIMQSYANFTVGGSLSVNAHGRYVGRGPLIESVRSLKVILADGTVVEASPDRHADIFNGVIGGYGGLGVITEVTFELTDNVKVRRHHQTMPITEYQRYFVDSVGGSSAAVFHNGDIYPNAYDAVHAVTYTRTDDPVTVTDRLIPADTSYYLDRFGAWMISEWPFGKAVRQHVVDPVLFRGESVTWRNYEASYDTVALEPSSRARSTYVLQEDFVPLSRFDEFVPRMREVFQRHDVNVINVSIRHATKDPGSLLAWAPTEVFAFVVYYKQGTSESAQTEVGTWTRELIDAALSVGGSYYLPYQLHATQAQFHRAYPRAGEFVALKQRLDPVNKFRNELWNKYYPRR